MKLPIAFTQSNAGNLQRAEPDPHFLRRSKLCRFWKEAARCGELFLQPFPNGRLVEDTGRRSDRSTVLIERGEQWKEYADSGRIWIGSLNSRRAIGLTADVQLQSASTSTQTSYPSRPLFRLYVDLFSRDLAMLAWKR